MRLPKLLLVSQSMCALTHLYVVESSSGSHANARLPQIVQNLPEHHAEQLCCSSVGHVLCIDCVTNSKLRRMSWCSGSSLPSRVPLSAWKDLHLPAKKVSCHMRQVALYIYAPSQALARRHAFNRQFTVCIIQCQDLDLGTSEITKLWHL